MADEPLLDKISQNTLDFAEHLRQRALGNANDQRFCRGYPNRNYEFGILYSLQEAKQSRRGDRTDIRPNAISASFEVEDIRKPLHLQVTPSFWLYFCKSGDRLPAEDAGDLWCDEVVWVPWEERPTPLGSNGQGDESGEAELPVFIRARYCKPIDIIVDPTILRVEPRSLDLEKFRDSRIELGRASNWQGSVEIYARRLANGHLSIRVTLENTYDIRPYMEPAWFDVRMRVKCSQPLLETYCPLLEKNIQVQTINCCVGTNQINIPNDTFEVEQINLAVRSRQIMRPAITFEEACWDNVAQTVRSFATEATKDHSDRLLASVRMLSGNPKAVQAMEIVLEAFRRAMRVRTPGKFWYRHQLAIIVLGAAEYLDGPGRLNPLVLNVPTAGGKTEAFAAAALWTIAYEALQDVPRWGVAIVKYPTKLLSSDQAERLTHYIMHFDNVLAERTNGRERRRGLGLFFGSDSEEIDRLDVIGQLCPECKQPWTLKSTQGGGPPSAVCVNGHSVVVALKDEIYPLPPTLIVGTIDKFVSKNRKTEMSAILGGGPLYWCAEKKRYFMKDCCYLNGKKQHDHSVEKRKTRLTVLVLDEAHLLREDVGSLDAHFETLFLETARELGGRYPLSIISTATIAQAAEHCHQLGLGEAFLFPGKGRNNYPVYYEIDASQVQHVVLSLMPRGRAIAWALPKLLTEFLRLHIQAKKDGKLDWNHLSPAMVYCGSYTTLNQTLNSIRRQVDKAIEQTTRVGDFSRRRFTDAGMRKEVGQIREQDVIVSTNIASVGIDLGELNVILYFGMPYNVNEFIQSMNRTGRRLPALCCIVHNPYLERDAAFYAYMNQFLSWPEALVEAVPLNRYARNAVEHTFATVAISELQNIWGPKLAAEAPNIDLRRARMHYGKRGFREVWRHELNDAKVLALLQKTYRSDGDPSHSYPIQIAEQWEGMALAIANYAPRQRGRPEFPYGDNWIWNADGIPEPMWQLRIAEPTGILEFTPEALRLKEAEVKAIYGVDRDEHEEIRDEEVDIKDGALADPSPSRQEGADE
jgi:hypothetical protein